MSGLNLVLPKGEGKPECFILCLIYIFEDLLKSISSFQILETKDLCYNMASLIF